MEINVANISIQNLFCLPFHATLPILRSRAGFAGSARLRNAENAGRKVTMTALPLARGTVT